MADGFRISKRDLRDLAFPADGDIAKSIKENYGFDGDLLDIFVQSSGKVVHKWQHYIPLYDRYLSQYRGTPVKFLEIGVYKGGSMELWRKYFGEEAVIYGIDINPECAEFNDQAGQVRIGSQDDPEFLAEIIDEMGGADVILDDGSHVMAHIQTSLNTLFPLLNMGGTYIIEDLHTAYLRRFGGGYSRDANFYNHIRGMIDDMHAWYHGRELHFPNLKNEISGIHVHDSMVILDKSPMIEPMDTIVQ